MKFIFPKFQGNRRCGSTKKIQMKIQLFIAQCQTTRLFYLKEMFLHSEIDFFTVVDNKVILQTALLIIF